ncbi:hypothetical protein C1646_759494 [Rhizophagus diaphanus]|nr:hypothetical protein C1646_759494 [Rhizophagus diaphanus] [Rhizophagus sp. MUCL 43196]
MTCSKIFSGELPELTYEIIKYFQNDFSTLHSCILVNRLWCRLAIPLLWKNPFSISTGNYNFIGIYLHNLNGELKIKLNKYDIDKLLPKNILFNYPNFIKHLNIHEFISSVGKWFEVSVGTLKHRIQYIMKNDPHYSHLETDFKRLVHKSLINIFIENKVNLYTLDIEISTYYTLYFSDILEIILQNTNFIQNIKYLKLYTCRTPGFFYLDNINEDKLTKYRISQIINLHQNLKKIVIDTNDFLLYKSLLLSKDSNCSNTLNTIILYSINFKGIINLYELFEQLNVLESVHIIYCYPINIEFIQQIINLSKPFKLKSLFINKSSQIDESLELLLQKSGVYLENFGSYLLDDISPKQLSLELITKYCRNIKFLDLNEYESHIIYSILNLIENIKQNLSYLSINIYQSLILSSNNDECIKCSSFILQNLGQILPSKLEYLSLTLQVKVNNFELFLKNIQNIFIKKLLINNKDGDDILPYIKQYIMKKERVNYLAIKISSYRNGFYYYKFNNKDLSYLKDEVEEFRLSNIKVQNYNDSIIEVYDYIKETD